MPTRNISLTAEQDAFVEHLAVARPANIRTPAKPCGTRCARSSSADGRIALKLKALRAQVKAGHRCDGSAATWWRTAIARSTAISKDCPRKPRRPAR